MWICNGFIILFKNIEQQKDDVEKLQSSKSNISTPGFHLTVAVI